jgi:predicted DNA-binding antitoxin AbrB/MazE fold protein
MGITVEAIYEAGVLKPLTPLPELPEHTKVRITVEALPHEACRQGFDVLFVNTHKMLQHLHGGRADGTWAKRVAL